MQHNVYMKLSIRVYKYKDAKAYKEIGQEFS